MMTSQAAMAYNWEGRGRKRAFKDLENIRRLIQCKLLYIRSKLNLFKLCTSFIGVVRRSHTSAATDAIKIATQNWLKYATNNRKSA